MSDLPQFKHQRYDEVLKFLSEILTTPARTGSTILLRLLEFDDGHYRAVFSPQYFLRADGRHEPTKSQWNTLKKRMKRHRPDVFVFKVHGETDCQAAKVTEPKSPEERCYYIDFGFFAH